MNKLNTKENKSFKRSLKYVIPYTYIQKKLMRSKNTMFYETQTGIFCKLMLITAL
jgi:hypothetical protein